jgi:hypothetical protein
MSILIDDPDTEIRICGRWLSSCSPAFQKPFRFGSCLIFVQVEIREPEAVEKIILSGGSSLPFIEPPLDTEVSITVEELIIVPKYSLLVPLVTEMDDPPDTETNMRPFPSLDQSPLRSITVSTNFQTHPLIGFSPNLYNFLNLKL